MSLFVDHKYFYKALLSLDAKKENDEEEEKDAENGKFIGLVSKICNNLDNEQIFNLYNKCRENIAENPYIGKNEIFSTIVLNVLKLLTNQKLNLYDDILSESISDELIDNYILNTQFSFREQNLRNKINMLTETKDVDLNELQYCKELYYIALTKYIPRMHGIVTYDPNNLESSVVKYFNKILPIKQALFHAEILVEDKGDNNLLVKHYTDDRTKQNTKSLLEIKQNFLNYLSNELPKYNEIITATKKVERLLEIQEGQELLQKTDWLSTERVLDSICLTFKTDKTESSDKWLTNNVLNHIHITPDEYNIDNPNEWLNKDMLNSIYSTAKRFEVELFFGNDKVQKYLTPTTIGTGTLYVQGLKESEVMRDLTEYLIENISNGKIKAHTKHSLTEYVNTIMPQTYARDISAALTIFSKM